MPEGRRIVHVDLRGGLPDLSRASGDRSLRIVWWWRDAPVGHDDLPPGGLPPRVLADRVARRIAELELAPPSRDEQSGGPSVALVILALDRPALLERCLRSVLAGTHRPAEIVVVERGETPGAAARPDGVSTIAAPGATDGAARNAAVSATESEVVTFLDAAAEVSPVWLGRLTGAFADPLVMAVGGPELASELDTNAQIASDAAAGASVTGFASRRTGPGATPPSRLGGVVCLSLRRQALELAGPFDPGLGAGAGLELLGRVLARGGRCVFEPGAAVLHPPPHDERGVRRRAADRRRGDASGLLAQFALARSPGALARVAVVLPLSLGWAVARESLRTAASRAGLTPPGHPAPAGADLRGHLEGVWHVAIGTGPPAPRHKAGLREFVRANPFPHPRTEGFFYREKMRAVHRVAPDASLRRVLEIGGGRSGLARKLYPAAHVTSTDLDPAHAEAFTGDPQTTFQVADATALPFEDGSFDAVTLLDVLEHIPDDIAAAREAWRVLAPGGWVIVSSPNLRWRSPYHAVMRPICPTSEDMIARWEHVRTGYELADLERLFDAPPAATADFINPVTVVAHDLTFSHLPGRTRRALIAALSPVTWTGYALQRVPGRGTETAASWRKPR